MPRPPLALLLLLLLHQTPAAHRQTGAQRTTPLPKLSDFNVALGPHPHPHAPILRTPGDRRFRTHIREAAAGGVNFAGHYALATWGCGSGCAQFAIVDLNTGKVHHPGFDEVDFHYPPADSTETNWQLYPEIFNYAPNSRLLIIEGCLRGKLCGRNAYVMQSTGLRHITYDPDRRSDGSVAPF